ncbi:GAF domain-containing protein [Luteimonas fraxinea]|uniref:GAF domain-containing protein n=1 Tax=Luteimonas fraxinea TaxID=2901869 RepID=A0ABS8U9J7_9GAMM|nr:GAF domain-containing protein [Luteimonas fraxinea]MCD9095431.1 GAF domain-containing protein [Luteimonas fraxinea]MCD9126328.1 GAF domain-containing protein [Luteimonas fraxinea]UHH11361.1 GAF domain-containing protein [Luteimonas fraxinea]
MSDAEAAQRDLAAINRIAAVPKILEVITRTTGLRFAAVARVTDTRWTACAVRDEVAFGLAPGGELELRTTICDEIRQHRQPVVFGHASQHPEFADHHTPRLYGLESYISVPIHRANGEFFGTLCAIDPLPSAVETPETLQMMELFAELIGTQLETDEKHAWSEAALHTALDVAKARERFIHAVGDDLKEPIQALVMDAYLIRTTPGLADDIRARVVGMETNLWHMASVVGGINDFAHDRLANGVPLVRTPAAEVAIELQRVLSQVVSAHPERALVTAARVERDVDCDVERLGQLLVNLANNVLRHVAPDATVSIDVSTTDEALVFNVQAPGLVLSGNELDSVSGPLTGRGIDTRPPRSWDFFIAGEIARAHAGRIDAATVASDTRLSFVMPLHAAVVAETPASGHLAEV